MIGGRRAKWEGERPTMTSMLLTSRKVTGKRPSKK
jgi:hypothetical protein